MSFGTYQLPQTNQLEAKQRCGCPASSPEKMRDAAGIVMSDFVWNIFNLPE